MKIQKLASMLASTSIAFSAFADDHGEKDQLSPFNVIGTKADVPSLKGSGAILDKSDLDKFYYTDINDILRQVPGVYVRPETGYGFFPNISLRGVDPNRSAKVTLMEDGIPTAPTPYADPSAYYSPTAGRMAGFEVLKGTSSLKHGPNTTGGVINYLSTPIPNQQLSHLRASYGTDNERVAHAYSGGRTDFGGGKLGYLLELFDHRSDGFHTLKSLNGAPDRNAPIERTDILLKLSYEFGEGDYLEFKAGRMDMDADVSYQGLSKADYATNPYQRYANTDTDNMDSDQTRYYLRYNKEFSDSLTMSTTVFLNEFNRNWLKLAKVGTSASSTTKVGKGVFADATLISVLKGETDGYYEVKSNDRSYQSKGILANFDYEVGINDIDFGFSYIEDDYDKNPYYTDKYTVTVAGTTTTRSKIVDDGSANYAYKDAEAFEAYIVDDIDFGALSLTPGVRYSSIDYANGTNARSLDDVIVGLGGTYELSDTLGLFSGIHQGHTFPDAESVAADNLDQEESLSFEVGARGVFSDISFEFAYFNTHLKDMLVLSNLNNGVAGSANIGEGSIDGLEVQLATDLGTDGGFGIPVSASFTFTNTEFESSTAPTTGYLSGASAGNEFPYVPDFMMNLRGGLVFDKASTYLNFHYQGSSYTDGANSNELNKYGSLDWSAFYDVSEGVTVFTKVTNLTDETYVQSVLPDGYRVGKPRAVSVGMSYDF
ncbi:TonB-dependent receptor family protein [Candidatus Seribacter sulfatis]|jgi:Fe(3+) dicitrate transport protein|uniref:TonB-dependent receptor family protein n=1 Tax=Candidatus Seribacter sulfatis TaxID=3381756 RepID=UPI0038999E0D